MHSCPDCGQACYCHGDIDDAEVEDPKFSAPQCVCECGDDHLPECLCERCENDRTDAFPYGIDVETIR